MRCEFYPDQKRGAGGRHLIKVDGKKAPRAWAVPDGAGMAVYVHAGWFRDRLLALPLLQLPDRIRSVHVVLASALTHCPYVSSVTYVRTQPRLRFEFQFWMDDWKGDWTIADYVLRLRDVVRELDDPAVRWVGSRDEFRDIYEGFSVSIAGANRSNSLQANIDALAPKIGELHRHTQSELEAEAREGAVVVRFEFPEEVRVPCEQYLVYFADFLKDLGVGADTALNSEAGSVLFSVKPTDSAQALEQIREALDIYLRLPASPISEVSFDDVAAQKLLANIRHLEGQLALAQAVMRAQQASIEAQATTIINQQKILSGDIVINSVTPNDREELVGGAVTLTKYEGKGFEINLAQIMRRLRNSFSKK